MSDPIERIPSLRRPVRQGVPKRKPHDMAKPMAESGKTKDAPTIGPREPKIARPTFDEPDLRPEATEPPVDPTLAVEMELAAQPLLEPVSPPVSVIEPQPAPEPEPEPDPVRQPEPEPSAQAQNWVASAQSVPDEPVAPPAPPVPPRLTLKQLIARVDEAFAQFRALAYKYPAENMTDRLTENGWTRKQMLAHIAAWHDLTSDRLTKMALSGQSVPLDRSVDSVNAQAARVAVGKSVGEILKDTEMTIGRLRRQLLRMSEDQIHADDDWAIHVVASNTYEHYVDHLADLVPPEPSPGTAAGR